MSFRKYLIPILIFMLFPLRLKAQGPFPGDIAEDMRSQGLLSCLPLTSDYASEEGIRDAALSVRASSAEIQIGEDWGEGCIYSIDEDYIYLLTSAHIINDPSAGISPTVIFYSGAVLDGDIIYTDESHDLCVIRVPSGDLRPEDMMHLKAVLIDENEFEEFENTDEKLIFVPISDRCVNPKENQKYDMYGNGTGIAESYAYGPVIKNSIKSTDFGFEMLYAKCSARGGMSGGGVFNNKGYLIGILAGGSDDDEIVAVRLPDILRVLSDIEAAPSHELSGE